MTARLVENGTEIAIDGDFYTSVLERVHVLAQPRRYFEIGTLRGDTLRLARCRSVAVDPAFQLNPDLTIDPARITLRQMTSDAYFAEHDPRRDLGRKIDFAFLDGMHEFPFLLRDFINTERACAPRAIVALHDCLPLDSHMTRLHSQVMIEKPTNHPGYWTGDVWKMIPVLRKYRPDLTVTCLDAPPTGLAMIRGLDPRNTVLRDRYDEILREWESLTLDDFGIATLLETARVESAAAWCAALTPMHPQPLRRLGAVLQPRRRWARTMAALGLESRAP